MKLYQHIETLWDYMQLKQELQPADCLIVMGSNDVRVAEHAARLYQQKIAPIVVFTGNVGRYTSGEFEQTEAQTFADIAMMSGLPKEAILLETRATNTGENIRFSEQLLQEHGVKCDRILLLQKPFMERRALATFEQQWKRPYTQVQVTSSQHCFIDYVSEDMPLIHVVDALMGDFSRIKHYPAKGFQTAQPIPASVEDAYQTLRSALSSALTN